MKKVLGPILAFGLSCMSSSFADSKEAKIAAVGDTAICQIYVKSSGNSGYWMLDVLERIEKEKGLEAAISYPFETIEEYLTDRIAVCNLEGVYTNKGVTKEGRQDKTFAIFLPEKYLDALNVFDLANMGNNHSMDYRNQGLYSTTKELQKRNIAFVGARKNMALARSPVVLSDGGMDVAFLSYNLKGPHYTYATDKTPGCAGSLDARVVKGMITKDIPLAKEKSDAVVVQFHWGNEGTHEVNSDQVMLGHAAIDLGASLVIGHHPHVLQRAEEYKGKLIAYSLGNFVFGGSYNKSVKHSAILQAEINEDGNINGYRFIPLNVHSKETNYQPIVLEGESANKVFDILNLKKSN